MKKLSLLAVITLLSLAFVQCGPDQDPFLIKNGAVGPLTKDMMIRQVDSVFEGDSLVLSTPVGNTLGTQGEVEIYEQGGAKLLLVSPEDPNDPYSKISYIHVYDARYRTEKGLTINSTFADIKQNYEIKSIENAINSVVIFLKDSEVYLTIDKKELPEDIRYNYTSKIEATQIPDEAGFKYFMIGWDHTEE